MVILPDLVGPSRKLHIKLPDTFNRQTYTLMIKDLKGKACMKIDAISFPSTINLKGLRPGKYLLTIKGPEHFFGTLVTAT